jgi:serine/threonine protein kinase
MAIELTIDGEKETVHMIGPYIPTSSLGSGGEGQVLSVIGLKTFNQLAMRARFAVGDDYAEPINRLLNARKMLQEVGPHDHILPFLGGSGVEVLTSKGYTPCFFNLYKKIKYLRDNSEGFSPQEVARIGADILSALQRMHEKAWVHRDVKPDNILIEAKDNHVWLSDFGLVYKMRDGLIEDNWTMGSPNFMSPEQVHNQYVEPPSDIYNLGASLYNMLTGKPPHVGESALQIMYRTRHDEPEPISNFRQDVPEMLDYIVMKMLEKNPKNRGDERELEFDLRGIESYLRETAENPGRIIKPRRLLTKSCQTTKKVRRIV